MRSLNEGRDCPLPAEETQGQRDATYSPICKIGDGHSSKSVASNCASFRAPWNLFRWLLFNMENMNVTAWGNYLGYLLHRIWLQLLIMFWQESCWNTFSLPCLQAVMVSNSFTLDRLVLLLKESNPDVMLLLQKPPVFDQPWVWGSLWSFDGYSTRFLDFRQTTLANLRTPIFVFVVCLLSPELVPMPSIVLYSPRMEIDVV